VALANQGETVLAWDPATGKPLSRAIVWQDNRSASVCARLGAAVAEELRAITGLPLDPYFAAPKMTWLRENVTRDGVVTYLAAHQQWLGAERAIIRHLEVIKIEARPGQKTVLDLADGDRPSQRGAQSRSQPLAKARAVDVGRQKDSQQKDHRQRADEFCSARE
jgi:hypothetical protein